MSCADTDPGAATTGTARPPCRTVPGSDASNRPARRSPSPASPGTRATTRAREAPPQQRSSQSPSAQSAAALPPETPCKPCWGPPQLTAIALIPIPPLDAADESQGPMSSAHWPLTGVGVRCTCVTGEPTFAISELLLPSSRARANPCCSNNATVASYSNELESSRPSTTSGEFSTVPPPSRRDLSRGTVDRGCGRRRRGTPLRR